jgi:chromate transport protein ChrA
MFWLWLIVAILLIAGGMYVLGVLDWDEDEKLGLFWTIFVGSLGWPLVLTAVIIIGPFFGLFWLGDRNREKRKAAAKAAAENK